MIERQNLSVLYAPLKSGLSESACSPMTCQKGLGEHGGGAPIPPIQNIALTMRQTALLLRRTHHTRMIGQ